MGQGMLMASGTSPHSMSRLFRIAREGVYDDRQSALRQIEERVEAMQDECREWRAIANRDERETSVMFSDLKEQLEALQRAVDDGLTVFVDTLWAKQYERLGSPPTGWTATVTITGDGSGVALPPIQGAPVGVEPIPCIAEPRTCNPGAERPDPDEPRSWVAPPLTWDTVRTLRAAGSHETARIAAKLLLARKRRPWWRRVLRRLAWSETSNPATKPEEK